MRGAAFLTLDFENQLTVVQEISILTERVDIGRILEDDAIDTNKTLWWESLHWIATSEQSSFTRGWAQSMCTFIQMEA